MHTRRVIISDSTQISEIFYDPENDEMRVFFKNGDCYSYENVPPHLFGDLISADSVGAFFATIKSMFNYKKVK